jgi:hypothetical protein
VFAATLTQLNLFNANLPMIPRLVGSTVIGPATKQRTATIRRATMTETEQTQQAVTNSTATPTPNQQQDILVQRLRQADLNTKRFLKVAENKAAFEKEWQNNLYGPDDLASYPCWGICS